MLERSCLQRSLAAPPDQPLWSALARHCAR
jgi:hypothetical protein